MAQSMKFIRNNVKEELETQTNAAPDWNLTPNVKREIDGVNNSHSDNGKFGEEIRNCETETTIPMDRCDSVVNSKRLLLELYGIFSNCEHSCECDLCDEYILRLYEHVNSTHVRSSGPVFISESREIIDPSQNSSSVNNFDILDKNIKLEPEEFVEEDVDVDPLLIQDVECQTNDKNVKLEGTNSPSFSSTGQLEHEIQKLYKCLLCDFSFLLRVEYDRHMFIHTGVKLYSCRFCDLSYDTMTAYERHFVNHAGEKPYKCETCGNTFGKIHHLSRHSATHSGDKPFKCKTCGLGYYHRKSLQTHMSSHSNPEKL